MANCHNLFLDLNSAIALSSSRKKILRASRDAVREKIRNYFRDKKNGFSPKFHGQGSFIMNTIIEPLDGEFDIDDGIYFKVEAEPNQSISTFHSWISEAVNGHTKQEPIGKQTCVRLVYARHYHLDLPIYYIIEGQTPRLAHKNKGWIESDPREFIKWFNEKASDNGQLKRIVRYLKAWSDYRKGDLPSGLIFSILATNNIIYDEYDDVSLYKTLVNIKSSLTLNFACYRPTTPVDENLLETCSNTNKGYLLTQLDSFIKSAEQALDDNTSLENACKAWQRHFGNDRFVFDSYKELTASCLSESSTSNTRQDKNILTNCDDTEEFIENYFPIHLQYNLKVDCRVSQDGFMTRLLREFLLKRLPLLPGKKLEFFIADCDVPKPFSVKWKVRNVEEEAVRRNCIRGQILSDGGNHQRLEHSDFHGAHFVECYIIKNNVCVARSRIDVPINHSI
ncbi:MAG: hypothetical protein CLLPBCKN_007385 [Chroococcidiopsis cubana SAG 39.79]|uniref:Cyclic GMP-AMP synthase n=1 Tax=Chroococcidiopsis cubana SAG 39.79 TaxID=388085 RepID=A0AB37UF61_9CYAN|nr:hypothetical protein [Chroococcidiopsis cubana]MDZ4877950.1 hypothetical protein [Chroococcidiopsis cubana SAG 39.79]PSB57208.1 hypothetical protein C7B79_31250 [Chroococcidiopsis cubana CCALA 043]RUT06937.1 nucleotidyltransferase [Chroococcidiopsis cubana SAG 39.79]